VSAPSRGDIFRARVLHEHRRLLELEAASCGRLRIETAEPADAPRRYLIVLHVRGVVGLRGDEPETREDHAVAIELRPRFPAAPPAFWACTPLWHPNVGASGGVASIDCLPGWSPMYAVDKAVERLYDLIRYEPGVVCTEDPMNPAAAEWYVRYRSALPCFFPLATTPLCSRGTTAGGSDKGPITFRFDPKQGAGDGTVE